MTMIEGQVRLGDGRQLGYAEWGPATAPAILYFHGFPGSHAEIQWFLPVIERHGIRARIVAFDRPGFGSSTFEAHRGFLDWPRDVAEAADRLAIPQFAVLGMSGGGPYALACGFALGDRVTRVGVVAGLAPTEAPGMETAAISGTSTNRLLRRAQFTGLSMLFNRGQEERFIEKADATMGSADQTALKDPETRRVFLESVRGGLVQGGRANAHEAGMHQQSWGFDLGKITTETHLWYGGIDEMVPASAGQWLAEQIPGSKFVLWPQHGHLTWGNAPEATDAFTTILGTKPSPSPTNRTSPHPQREVETIIQGESAMSQTTARKPRLPPRWFMRLVWHAHRRLYRLTGGRVGLRRPKPNGWGIMRLTTIGRRTGEERNVMVGYFEDDANLVTVAMNGWGEGDPAWWRNLQAHPDIQVNLADGPRLVTAREAKSEERERLWGRWRNIDSTLDDQAAHRSTDTPVVILEPRSAPKTERRRLGPR